MTDSRQAQVPGAVYFFTVALAERSQDGFLVEHAETLRTSIREVRKQHPFDLIAIAVLPDHVHTIWQLPHNDDDHATRWSLIKARFSRAIPKGDRRSDHRQSKRDCGIWQRRYSEHQIRDDDDLKRHVEFIHHNPVRHGYAKGPIDWRYSSFKRYVDEGLYAADWAADTRIQDLDRE